MNMNIIPPNEKLVETKICRHCSASFPITDKDLEFYSRISPVLAGKKYEVPTPTLCPECRNQRRLAWRSRRKMYKRNCDATGQGIISMFSPDKPLKVYHTREWESDKFDPKSYGREYDFSISFFEQYRNLLETVPLPHLAIVYSTLENSDYVNGANSVKNSYLSNSILNVDSVYYCEDVYDSDNCIDCLTVRNSQECSDCINSFQLYNCQHLYECESCSNSSYCSYCKWCTHCIGCINLQNKQYCIFNQQYTKEEYEKMRSELTSAQIQSEVSKLFKLAPHKFGKIINSENVQGENIVNSKNCSDVSNVYDSEGIKHSFFVMGNSKDCQDISYWWQEISHCYEGQAVGLNSTKVLFSSETCENISESLYCYFCYPNSSHLFGCIGIKNSQYCILNKQYTQAEYETLVRRIIEQMTKTSEWGEFFPASISPFGYNETVAAAYFPLSKGEAVEQGFTWSDYEAPFPKVEKIIPGSKLPDDITKIPDDILNWAIECEVTKRPFRIIKQELEFYRKHNLPIPRRHPDQRHLDRMAQRNPRKLFERKCDNCSKDMITTYSPERPEKVYCESCYEKEVIG